MPPLLNDNSALHRAHLPPATSLNNKLTGDICMLAETFFSEENDNLDECISHLPGNNKIIWWIRLSGSCFQRRQLLIVSTPDAPQTTQCQMTISLAKIRNGLSGLRDTVAQSPWLIWINAFIHSNIFLNSLAPFDPFFLSFGISVQKSRTIFKK